jgi:predicted secreted protein
MVRRTMLLAFALVVGACGGSSSETTTFTTDIIDPGPESGAATFFLTEADSGAILRVQPGDEVVTRLSTDGAAWELRDGPDTAIVAGGDSFFFEPSEGGVSAGYQEFSFTAAGTGSTTITIVRGSGETLTFTVEVG